MLSFVTQMFSKASHGPDCSNLAVMTSTEPLGTLGSVVSLLAARANKEVMKGTTKME